MSRFSLFAALLMLVGMAFAPAANAQLGVAAGLNFESFDDLDVGNSRATYDNASGYHVGIFYDLGAGPAGVRAGLFYRDVGDVDVSFSGAREAFDLSMIDIPVDVRLNLTATPVIRPYVLAGPLFSFPMSGDDEFDDELKDVAVSGNVGIGVSINLAGVTLFPELRYAIGISRFMDDSVNVGGINFEANDEQRLNTVKLRLGVRF